MNDQEFVHFLRSKSLRVTADQWAAISAHGEALAIYAGPGSGKTTVLIVRAAYLYLVQGMAPEHIVIFTFTRKSAFELKNRLERFLPALKRVVAGTFHSLFLRFLLRDKHVNPQLLSTKEQRTLMISALTRVRLPNDREICDRYLQSISQLKNQARVVFTMDENDDCIDPVLEKIYAIYEEIKRDQDRFDYDDILITFYQAIRDDMCFRDAVQSSMRAVMVDEFQDTSRIQWLSIKLLCKQSMSLTVVGDDDQSIYRFRSADPHILATFEREYPQASVVVLRHNFRSTDPIIRLATQMIEQSDNRKKKSFIGVIGAGVKPALSRYGSEWDEAERVANAIVQLVQVTPKRTIGVLARTNRQLICLVDALRSKHLLFTTQDLGTDLYKDFVVQRLLFVLQATRYNANRTSLQEATTEYAKWLDIQKLDAQTVSRHFEQFLHTIRHLSAKSAIQYAREVYDPYLSRSRQNRSLHSDGGLDQLQLLYEKVPEDQKLSHWLSELDNLIQAPAPSAYHYQIQLLTFHGAKGLEFDDVFVIGLHDQAVPHRRAIHEASSELDHQIAIDEERRLLYVALTRARYRLFMSYSTLVLQHQTNFTPFLDKLLVKKNEEKSFTMPTDATFPAIDSAVPDIGVHVVHKIFGGGVVISVNFMQNMGHKICIMFNEHDCRCFYWEMLYQLNHISKSGDRGKGIQS
ncbi:MAG: ATP-dependent helicase [Acidibacillus sp.]|nr:ATP-dependent helicase [Acidibacillus sp.]